MNTFQQGRKNTDFILRLMIINRQSSPSKEDMKKLVYLIDKEERHLVENYKLGFRGSFHKQILHILSDDIRVKVYMKDLLENDCRTLLYNQLGVIEALRDFFHIDSRNINKEIMVEDDFADKILKEVAPAFTQAIHQKKGCGVLLAKSEEGDILCGDKPLFGKKRYCINCSQNVQIAKDPKDREESHGE